MARGLKFVQQVVNQVRMSNEDFDNSEGVKTDDVRNSASAVVEIRRLKAENEAQVRISSLEHDLVEIEGLHDGVKELADAQAQVTEVKEAMESYLEKGGMTRDAARFAEIAMKNITSRVFMPVSIPSLESFTGSSADRTDMTIVSMEAADSWYVKAWEAIKKFFASIFNKITGWFKKSEASEKDAKEAVEAAEKKVDALPDNFEKKAEGEAQEAEGDENSKLLKWARLGIIQADGHWEGFESVKVAGGSNILMMMNYMFTNYPEVTLKSVNAMKNGDVKAVEEASDEVRKSGKFEIVKQDDMEYVLPKYPMIGGTGVSIGGDPKDESDAPKFVVTRLKFVPTSQRESSLNKARAKSFLGWCKSTLNEHIPAWKKTNGDIIKAMDSILNDPLPAAEKIAASQKIEVEVAEKSLRKLVTALKDLYASPAILSMYLDVIKGIQQGVSEIENAIA